MSTLVRHKLVFDFLFFRERVSSWPPRLGSHIVRATKWSTGSLSELEKVIKMIVIEIKIKVRMIWLKVRQKVNRWWRKRSKLKGLSGVVGGFEEHFSYCSVWTKIGIKVNVSVVRRPVKRLSEQQAGSAWTMGSGSPSFLFVVDFRFQAHKEPIWCDNSW